MCRLASRMRSQMRSRSFSATAERIVNTSLEFRYRTRRRPSRSCEGPRLVLQVLKERQGVSRRPDVGLYIVYHDEILFGRFKHRGIAVRYKAKQRERRHSGTRLEIETGGNPLFNEAHFRQLDLDDIGLQRGNQDRFISARNAGSLLIDAARKHFNCRLGSDAHHVAGDQAAEDPFRMPSPRDQARQARCFRGRQHFCNDTQAARNCF